MGAHWLCVGVGQLCRAGIGVCDRITSAYDTIMPLQHAGRRTSMDSQQQLLAGARAEPRGTRHTTRFRARFALLALASGGAGLALALHYPVVPSVMVGLFALVCAAFYRWPDAWLLVVPGILPLIGFAPWTGWLTFEELDMLVLAAAAGGYARRTFFSLASSRNRGRSQHASAGVWLLVLLFAVSIVVAMVRGFDSAGGFSFGWYQGYHESMNSVRLAKSFFLALLVFPLWRASVVRRGEQASNWLVIGVAAGLAAASLATMWERSAFVGLFNFSADYRTTALFWEMHVGGAALDGFLALSVPFVVRELLVARSLQRWVAFALCLAMAAYACLTTFSRGVYLALPIGIAVTGALYLLANRRSLALAGTSVAKPPRVRLLSALALLVIFSLAVWWTFPSSGYRGLLCLLGAMGLLMPLGGVLRCFTLADWIAGLIAGGLLSGACWGLAMALDKGAYLVYAASWCLTLALLLVSRRPAPSSGRRQPMGLYGQLALASYMAVVTGMGLVAQHWGYGRGLEAMLPVLAALLLLAFLSGSVPQGLWPDRMRWHATTWAAMAMVGGIVGVFGGGAYMGDRFSTSSSDLDTRLQHWSEGWQMLDAPWDPVLGKGLGRYPSSYFFARSSIEHPGDYRLASQEGNNYLVLAGGKQRYMGWGEILRVSQRILPPTGPVSVTLSVRVTKPVNVHLEVCEKHLLYSAGCLLGGVYVEPKTTGWQSFQVPLKGSELRSDDWFAPKLVSFSVATDSAQGLVDVDNIQLQSADGRELLDNGDFSHDLQRWFFSSDRNHLPWHIKNVFMNTLFDQGGVGLALFIAMGMAALWRVTLGRAQDHPLAPGIAGGLVGFVVVGLFDSLLDVPRLAFLFYFVLLLGMTLRHTSPAVAAKPSRRAAL